MKKLILGVAMMAAALTAQAANYLYWTLDFGELWSGTELTENPLLQPGEIQDVWLIATKTDGSETVKFTDDSYPIGPTITAAADANIGGAAWTDVTSLGDLQYWTFAFALGNYASGDWVVISEKTGYNVFKYSVTTDPTEIVQKVLNGAEDTVWHYLPLTLKAPTVAHSAFKFYTNGVEVAESATPGEYIVESNSTVTAVCTASDGYAFADGATELVNVIDRVNADPYLVEMTDTPHWTGTLYFNASGLWTDSGCTVPYDEETSTWSVTDGTLTMNDFAHPGKFIATSAVRFIGTGSICITNDDPSVKAFTAPDVDTLWVTVLGANPATNELVEAIWDETAQTFLVGGNPAQKLVFAVRPTSTLTVPTAPEGTKEVKVFVGDEEVKPNLDGTYSVPSNETVRVEYTADPGKFFDGTETKYDILGIDSGKDPVVFPTELEPAAPIVHTHCVCGHTDCAGTGHASGQNWTCVATLPASAGYYVLTNDVVISETYHPASGTYLCLAGHTITNTASGQAVITNDVGETFTLVDCTRLPGAVSGDVKSEGEIDLNRGTIEGDAENVTNNGGEVGGTTKGGEIRGGEISGPIQGATIYGGTFANAISGATIYGGVFTGPVSSSTVYGGLFTNTLDTVASGYAAQTIAGTDYKVVGKQNTISVVGGRLVGGTLTFNPTNSEYMATGVIPMEDVTVTENTGVSPTEYILVAGVVVYVSEDGDDSTGNGSVEKPYKKLQTAYNAIPTQGTIALLSDLSLASGFGSALNMSGTKHITLTSAAPSGLLLANAPGDYTGVYAVKRGALGADNLITAGGEEFVLRQVKIDGENQASRLIKHDAGEVVLDTNTILTGASNGGAIGVFAGTCKVTMKSNALIAGNSGLDGGIGLTDTSELHLSGDVVVRDNTYAGNPRNVSLAAKPIVVEGVLGENVRIGVYAETPEVGKVAATGTVSYAVTDADARHFLDDTGTYKLVKSGNAIVFAEYTTDDDRTLTFDDVIGGTNLVLTLDKSIAGLTAGDFSFTRNGAAIVPENVTLTVTDGTNLVVSVAGVDLDGYTIGVKIVNGGVKVNGGAEVTKFCTTHVHDGIEWKAWDATDALPTTAGNYFLKNDVTLTAEYVPVDGVNLCLNGKTVTQSASARVINVGAGVTFGLYDCQNAGVVTGGAADKGAGVSVAAGATFEMMGGAITGNVATVRGGGVSALGTVRIGTSAIILDNVVADHADNFCLGSGSALVVLGGSADFAQTIGLATDPMPTTTTPVAINCVREADDLSLRFRTDDADTVIRQRVDGTFELACANTVDTASGYKPNPGDPDGLYHFDAQRNPDGSVTLSGYWKTEDPTKTFTVGSYTGGFRKEYDDMTAYTNQNFAFTIPYEEIGAITEIYTIFGEDDAVTYAIDGVHEHCLCGDGTCTIGGHVCTNLLWRKWREADSLPTLAGNYFLAHDVTLTNTAALKDGVNLCLRGHNIIQTKDGESTVTVLSGTSAALTECQSTPGAIMHATGLEGIGLSNSGRFTMYGGAFRDNVTTNNGGAVCTQTGAVTLVYGGLFAGNQAAVGGALATTGDATNCVYGGTFVGNTATSYGGAIANFGSTLLGGNPIIHDNLSSVDSGLATKPEFPFTVSDDCPLADDVLLAVAVVGEDASHNVYATTGRFSSNGTTSEIAHFTAENPNFTVEVVDGHLELLDPTAIVSFKGEGPVTLSVTTPYWDGSMQASTNANEWFTWDGAAITAADTLRVRGLGNTCVSYPASGLASCPWTLTGNKVVGGGRIDALLDCSKVALGIEPTSSKGAFYNLFNGATALVKAPELPLKRSYVMTYCQMFQDCTSLTETPEISLTNVEYQACQNMFRRCSSLTNGPSILPALRVAGQGYCSMFEGCSKLERAPVLPATTLGNNAYSSMFDTCSALKKFPDLPARNLPWRCYAEMFERTTVSLYSPGLGDYWMIPSDAVIEDPTWKTDMFKTTKASIPANCPIPGVKYHYAPWPQFQLTVPAVQNAAVKLEYADDFVRPGEVIGSGYGNYNVYSNFNVRVIYTADYGHYFADGVTCFTNIVSLQKAGTAPAVSDAIAHWHDGKLIEKWIGTSADLASLLTTDVMTNGWFASNVVMSADITMLADAERYICLNGKALDLDGHVLTVSEGSALTLGDCQGGSAISNGEIKVDGILAVEKFTAPLVDGVLTAGDSGVLLLGTNAVLKMGADFTLTTNLVVVTEQDLAGEGYIKVLEPAAGVTTLDLEAIAAKVVPYDPFGRHYSVMVIGNAVCVAAYYRVTYDAIGGKLSDGSSLAHVYLFSDDPYAHPADPVREGFVFRGWYDGYTNGASKVENGAEVIRFADHLLYAKWLSAAAAEGEEIFVTKASGAEMVMLQGPATNATGEIEKPSALLVVPERADNTLNGKVVTTIGRKAFAAENYDDKVADEKKLRDVRLSTFLTRIGDEAFRDATKITNIVFTDVRDYTTGEKAVLDIGSRAFENTSVKTLVFPAGTKTKLRSNSFANCTDLSEIMIYGEITGIDKAPFLGCGKKGEELVIHLAPNYATNAAFVAKLTADLNTTRVKISTEPLGKVTDLSVPSFAVSGKVSFTFKVDLDSPWGEVNTDTVVMFYTEDLKKGFVGTGKFKKAQSVTGPDAGGTYRATFEDPAMSSSSQFFRITVGN